MAWAAQAAPLRSHSGFNAIKSREREGSALKSNQSCARLSRAAAVLVRQLRGPHFSTWLTCPRLLYQSKLEFPWVDHTPFVALRTFALISAALNRAVRLSRTRRFGAPKGILDRGSALLYDAQGGRRGPRPSEFRRRAIG